MKINAEASRSWFQLGGEWGCYRVADVAETRRRVGRSVLCGDMRTMSFLGYFACRQLLSILAGNETEMHPSSNFGKAQSKNHSYLNSIQFGMFG